VIIFYNVSVITLSIIARANEDMITALTEVIAGTIFPQIALASIARISPSPKYHAFILQPIPTFAP